MNTELHEKTIIAQKWEWVKSPIGCMFTGSADIGRAMMPNGQWVYCTWGLNINKAEQAMRWKMGYTSIKLGADDGSAELVIPDEIAKAIVGGEQKTLNGRHWMRDVSAFEGK